MSTTQKISRIAVTLCLAAAVRAVGVAQPEEVGNPLTRTPVLDAPFTADATTTIQLAIGNGIRIDRRATARYYRDRAGRVRVEQTITSPAADGQVRVTIQPEADSRANYTLDAATRMAQRGPGSLSDPAVGGGDTFAVPLGGNRFLVFARGQGLRTRLHLLGNPIEEEPLGTREISGVEVIGRRTTVTLFAGQLGNDRPAQIVDERWESPALQIVIESRQTDPRGVMDYRVTNITRTEPPANLFVIPTDYTVSDVNKAEGIHLEFPDPPTKPDAAAVARWR